MRKGILTGISIVAVCAAAVSVFLVEAQSNTPASTPMRLMADGHYTIPVMINGQEPFPFILDTGAQGSVLSPDLAARLSLLRLQGASVVATSGKGAGGISFLKSYSSPLFTRVGAMTFILPAGGLVKDGVVGMNLFTTTRLELNFANASARSDASGPTPAGFIPVHSSIVQGSFIVTDVTIDGVYAKAMIDTGARRTVANSRLQKALGISDNDARLSPADSVGGATAEQTKAVKAQVGAIMLGAYRFDHPTVTFSDIPVLQSLNISDVPAIVIGLDLLQTLKAVAIDYPRAELQLKP